MFISSRQDVNLQQSYIIASNNISMSPGMEKVDQVSFNQGVFFVTIKGKQRAVHSYDVRGLPLNLSDHQLEAFLQKGYLQLSQLSNGDCAVQAQVKGPAGSGKGPSQPSKTAAPMPSTPPPTPQAPTTGNNNYATEGVIFGTSGGIVGGTLLGAAIGGLPGAGIGMAYGALGGAVGGVVGAKIPKE